MKRVYITVFVIGYIFLYILKMQLSISRGLARVYFHLIHKTIKVSEKLFTMFVIKIVLELTSLHLQSINNHLYSVDKVSTQK